jgi:predicted MFS family arabinose efflux permease
MLAQWLPPAFVTGAESLLVPYSHARNLPDSMPGLLLASVPVGMILGEVVVGRLLPPGARERLVVPLVVILGLPLLAFVATPGPVLAGALLLISGTGFAYCLGIQRKFLDAVGEYRRGQAFGLLAAGLMTCQGLGPAVFGALAEVIPAGTSIAAAGAVTVLTAGALVASLSPSRREGIADERG